MLRFLELVFHGLRHLVHVLHGIVHLLAGLLTLFLLAQAGVPFTGHTEFFAERTRTPRVVMMLIGGGMRGGRAAGAALTSGTGGVHPPDWNASCGTGSAIPVGRPPVVGGASIPLRLSSSPGAISGVPRGSTAGVRFSS